jgi:two-component system, chemotaxis family, protein-glutamate methylesterase/glutaminase
MSAIRVLIVEDSPVVGEQLRRIISADPRFLVAGIAISGEEALELVHRLAPDVISMDIRLPGIQGFEATQRIMSERPTPIVVVSGIDMEAMTLTMRALRAGALSVVEKPPATTDDDYAALAGKLCTQLAIMSEVHVVRQRPVVTRIPRAIKPFQAAERTAFRLLAIAASTGGPGALMQLLTGLGADFPMPIAVVQHMTPAFLPGFAQWLGKVIPFPVSIVTEPTPLESAHVYLAPPKDHHLAINGLAAYCEPAPPIGGHRPSANFMFSSMARSVGAAGVGVVLTGMGDDGATGLLELKRTGAYTIAEDQSTAVVYGMPGAAVRMGAVEERLPLSDIASRVRRLTVEVPETAAE